MESSKHSEVLSVNKNIYITFHSINLSNNLIFGNLFMT